MIFGPYLVILSHIGLLIFLLAKRLWWVILGALLAFIIGVMLFFGVAMFQ
jgi:hypothetical protein